jgi:hypothetical protein
MKKGRATEDDWVELGYTPEDYVNPEHTKTAPGLEFPIDRDPQLEPPAVGADHGLTGA